MSKAADEQPAWLTVDRVPHPGEHVWTVVQGQTPTEPFKLTCAYCDATKLLSASRARRELAPEALEVVR